MASPFDRLSPEDQAYAIKVQGANPDATPEEIVEAILASAPTLDPLDARNPEAGTGDPLEQSGYGKAPTAKEVGKNMAYSAPAIAANAILPGAGVLSILGQAGLNMGGTYGVSKLLGDDPTAPTVLAGASSLVGGIGRNVVNKAAQGAADRGWMGEFLRRITGYQNVPDTRQGITNAVTPRRLPGSIMDRAGRDMETDLVGMARAHGNPHVNIGGQEMRFEDAARSIQSLGQRVDQARMAKAGEALDQLEQAYSAAKSQMSASLAQRRPALLQEYMDMNDVYHQRALGVRIAGDPSRENLRALPDSGRINLRAAQLNAQDRVHSGDVNTQETADIIRSTLFRGAQDWNLADQPGTLARVLAWVRAMNGNVGISASAPSLLSARVPRKIGQTATSPYGSLFSPGLPAVSGAISDQLRSLGPQP